MFALPDKHHATLNLSSTSPTASLDFRSSNSKSVRFADAAMSMSSNMPGEQTDVATLPKYQLCLDQSSTTACLDYWISGLDGSVKI